MTVTSILTSEGDECHLTGVGYSADGQVVFEGGYSELANEAVTKLLETGKFRCFRIRVTLKCVA